MAEMFPPELLEGEVKSEGERKVFKVLRDSLPAPWQAYHSVSWLTRDPGSGVIDGEMDFVLCHPDVAVLCLEVKGGNIDSVGGAWFTGPAGRQTSIRSPFAQATDHRYALKRNIIDNNIAGSENWLIGEAVVFPDVTVHELVLTPDAARELIIDRSDLRDIEESLQRVVAYHRGAREKRKAPGTDGAKALRQLLAPTVRLRLPLAEEFVDEQAQFVTLTQDQTDALVALRRNRQVAVFGCAGSGKTMLAVEQARHLAETGSRVLFACFNKALAESLAAGAGDSSVTYATFHKLCVDLAKEAGVELPDFGKGKAPSDYFSDVLPDALLEAAGILGPRFDALVIDEAQDFESDWYEILLCLLDDESKANVWLFFDENQRIFGRGFQPPEGFTKTDLVRNCRNTQAIHREVMKHYSGPVTPGVVGPPGRDVEHHQTRDQPAEVARIIERLCGEEEIPPQDIVVLSPHSWDGSRVRRAGAGEYEYTPSKGELGKNVGFSSISGYKGLEAPAVILCELEDLDDDWREQMLYVGISRAQSLCVFVESADEP